MIKLGDIVFAKSGTGWKKYTLYTYLLFTFAEDDDELVGIMPVEFNNGFKCVETIKLKGLLTKEQFLDYQLDTLLDG